MEGDVGPWTHSHVIGSFQEVVDESADGALFHSGIEMLAPLSAFVFLC